MLNDKQAVNWMIAQATVAHSRMLGAAKRAVGHAPMKASVTAALGVLVCIWFIVSDDDGTDVAQSEGNEPAFRRHTIVDAFEQCIDGMPASLLLGTIDEGAREMRNIPTCGDKFTAHRFQEMYSRMLYPYRQTNGTDSKHNSKLLEIGLGCQHHSCVASGAQLYRQYMPPSMAYHSLEPNIRACKERYGRSSVDAALSQYIDDHLCLGDASDFEALTHCGRRFGPFDVVVDDGSHMHAHTTHAFRYWLNSSSLRPGGVLIIEDLQVSGWTDFHDTASDAAVPHPPELHHPVIRGTTAMSYSQRLFLCKLAGEFCHAPPAGPLHAPLPYLAMIDEVVLGPEIASFRKAGALSGHPKRCLLSHDVSIVLAQPVFPHNPSNSPIVAFASKAHIAVVWSTSWSTAKASDECRTISSAATLMLKFFSARFGTHGFQLWHACLAEWCGVHCTLANLEKKSSAASKFNLIWVVTPTNTFDASTFHVQEEIVSLVSDPTLASMLRPGGVIAVDGFQERRSSAATRVPSIELKSPKDITEPLLRFIADLSMAMALLSPELRSARIKRMKENSLPSPAFPWVASPSAIRALWYVGDMSISSYGAMYLRKVDPINRRHLRTAFSQ